MERRMIAGHRDDTELWKRYDREFHQALIAACGSQTLLDLSGGVYDQYLRYQMVAVVFRGEVAAAEHRSLLDCALARDAEGACAILTRHVEGCVEHTLEEGRCHDDDRPAPAPCRRSRRAPTGGSGPTSCSDASSRAAN
jgi:DNA-binding GntR family transcriptional regulator